VPWVDRQVAEALFRHHVLRLLQRRELVSEERTQLLLSWRHSGFGVHNTVTVQTGDEQGLERLARYLLRPPISLERGSYDDEAGTVSYLVKRSSRRGHEGEEEVQTFDADELLARVLVHVAEPRQHLVRYYGEYSSVARARRRQAEQPLEHEVELEDGLSGPGRRAARRSWARLVRRVYETDPLICPHCGGDMKIIAFILEPAVIRRILRHLEATGRRPGRAPPESQLAS